MFYLVVYILTTKSEIFNGYAKLVLNTDAPFYVQMFVDWNGSEGFRGGVYFQYLQYSISSFVIS